MIKFFTKNIFKNKTKRNVNFIIYHFLVESKPHGRLDLLIAASENIYQTKKEKKVFQQQTCFSDIKLLKQFGTPLSTNLPISEQFFL